MINCADQHSSATELAVQYSDEGCVLDCTVLICLKTPIYLHHIYIFSELVFEQICV